MMLIQCHNDVVLLRNEFSFSVCFEIIAPVGFSSKQVTHKVYVSYQF